MLLHSVLLLLALLLFMMDNFDYRTIVEILKMILKIMLKVSLKYTQLLSFHIAKSFNEILRSQLFYVIFMDLTCLDKLYPKLNTVEPLL